jgi:hypothetical protein
MTDRPWISTDQRGKQLAVMPYEVLARISNRIINETRGINRVVYDISSKPQAPSSGNRFSGTLMNGTNLRSLLLVSMGTSAQQLKSQHGFHGLR